MSPIPYKSIQQMRFMHAQHPDIAARWDQEIREKKKKGTYRKPPRKVKKMHAPDKGWLKPLAVGVAGGAVANQFPSIGQMTAEKRAEMRREKRRQARIKKADYESVVHSDDPDFNHEAAKKIFTAVMKMDTDSAEMFCHIVASDLFETEVERNLRTLQKHLNQVIAKREEGLNSALARLALDGHDDAVDYAEALALVSKATPHTPQYYGYQWKESDFRRDPQTGRFMVKVHHTMDKPLKKEHAEQVIGSSGHEPKLDIKDDKARAKYQDEYRQVASFLEMASQAHGGSGNVEVVYHLKDDAGHRFQQVDNSGKPNKQILAEAGTTLEGIEAKPTALTHGGAAFGLATALGGTMTPEQMSRVSGAEAASQNFTRGWVEAGDNEISNMKTYQRLASTGALMGAIGAPGGKVQLAGKLAEVVGSYGPQAEQVIGPSARKTAYRYRGTERSPDKKLVSVYAQEIQDAKKYGFKQPTPEMEQRIADELGQRRYYGRGEAGRGRPEPRTNISPGVAPSIVQMARQRAGEKEMADREPDWNERTMGAMVVGEYLKLKIPRKGLYGLHLHAGNTPPSEGIIIDRNGSLAVQASGYGDDHYLPFNLKNLKALKGGEYIRNRSVGGLTSEDIYTGLMAGARRVTVVSRSGTFTMEFEPDFRGGRRHNDKALRMTRRYEQLLDAVQSGQVERREIPLKWRKQIEKEVNDEMEGAPKAQIRDEIKERIKEFKEDPEIDLRDRDRANAIIEDMDARAKRGEVRNYDSKQFRAQVMNELNDLKEVRFRLNGLGYEAALKSLQEQFPYYIRDVRTTTTKDEDLKEFERDQGYVEPGRNRPTAARAGLYNTEETGGSKKFSAALADYQRGRGSPAGYKAGFTQAAAKEPEKTEPSTSREDRLSERDAEKQKLADQSAEATKKIKARRAAQELRRVAKEGRPDFGDDEPPGWWDMKDEQFNGWIERPENKEEFDSYMTRAAKSWARQPSAGGLTGFASAWVNYRAAKGALNQVKYRPENAAFYPDDPYSFKHDTRPAYHPGARPGVYEAALKELDRKTPLFTSGKQLSELDDAERRDEIDRTQTLRTMVKGSKLADVLAQNRVDFPEGASNARISGILSSDKELDQHLENIHRSRYLDTLLQESKRTATTASKPAAPGSSAPSSGAGGTGGLPSAKPPASGGGGGNGGGGATATINARQERLQGAKDAVQHLHAQANDTSLSQKERRQAKADRDAIVRFAQRLQDKKSLQDPIHIDELMDEMLTDDQQNFVSGMFGNTFNIDET